MRRFIPGAQSISRRAGFGVVIAAIAARSFAGFYWEDVYFDADQAITGLMAKHIAEGRAFPVLQYGLPYALVLEAWLAAPLMAVSDTSISLLRLVPFVLNVASAMLLYGILTGGVVALTPGAALLATAPLALPGVGTANELAAAIGVNIETLFFTLVIWLLRRRPIALGVVAAIAIKNREFALYAVAALLFLDLLRDRSLALWRPRVAGAIAFAFTWSLIAIAHHYSSPFGPGTNLAMVGSIDDHVGVATNAMCIDVTEIPGDIRMLVTELLPFQYGVRSVRWPTAGHPGVAPPDASWLWLPLVGVLMFGIGRGLARARRLGPSALTWLGVYLVLVGLQAVIVYGVTRCGNASFLTLRYTLLSVFVATGAIVLALERESAAAVRALVIGVCTVWIGVCALGHATIAGGFLASPPAGRYRELATYLDEHDIRFIRTDYWTGYHVAFLTGERVRPLTEFDRVQDYMLAVRAHPDQAFEVRRAAITGCDNVVMVAGFFLCPPSGYTVSNR